MHDINLTDDSFLLKLTHTYHLSLQTGLNGLSYAILDLNKLRYVVLRHYPFDGLKSINEISNYVSVVYKEDNLLNRDYKRVSHLFVGDKSTLIPQQDYKPEYSEHYLQFLYNDLGNDAVLSNEIPVIQSQNVFSYPVNLMQNIKQNFKDVALFHHTTSFISSLLSESNKSSRSICMVFISEGILNMGIARNSKLLFFNTFKFKDKSDLAYFILSVLEQFNLPPKSADVYFSADIKEHDEIFSFLNNYLGHIRFVHPSHNFTYSLLFDERYLTRFANLFNLALCE